MKIFWQWVSTITHTDPDTQRRGRTLIILAFGTTLLLLVSLPFFWSRLVGIISVLSAIALFWLAILITRRSYVTFGALICIGTAIALPTIPPLLQQTLYGGHGLIYFLVAPLIAGVVLRPWQAWTITGICMAIIIGLVNWISQYETLDENTMLLIRNVLIIEIVIALVGSVASRSTHMVLNDVQIARSEAQQAAAALERSNHTLEQRVAERTTALTEALAIQQAQSADLQQALANQNRLNTIMAQMALPVIPVRNDVLVVPLLGQHTRPPTAPNRCSNSPIGSRLEQADRWRAWLAAGVRICCATCANTLGRSSAICPIQPWP
ncbi:MAG: hypothetical protein Fur005_26110 [Roseiflexaceae bacterium]